MGRGWELTAAERVPRAAPVLLDRTHPQGGTPMTSRLQTWIHTLLAVGACNSLCLDAQAQRPHERPSGGGSGGASHSRPSDSGSASRPSASAPAPAQSRPTYTEPSRPTNPQPSRPTYTEPARPEPARPRPRRSPGLWTLDARRTPHLHARTPTQGARRMTLLLQVNRHGRAEGTVAPATTPRAGARTRAGRHRAHPLASTTPRGNRQGMATRRTASAGSMAPGRKAAVLAAGRSISRNSAGSAARRYRRSPVRAAACARSARGSPGL